jgi:AcrR family transcriptional regulator
MPRQVSHDERRREISEALWRVVLRDGLCSATFREVAREANVSVRRVQYYFGTKACLLGGALQALNARVVERSGHDIERLGQEPTPRSVLRAAIAAALPTDPESRDQSLLFFSFYIAAITDSTLSSADALGTPTWTTAFAADLLQRAAERGELADGIDPEREAVITMTAFAGLSLAVLAGTQTPKQALDAIDYQLDRVFRVAPTLRRPR